MSRKALGLTVGLVVLLGLISVVVAQSRRPSQSALDQITQALNQGRYDQVAGLAAALDPQDPSVAALAARAAIARGKYQEAETALTPAAQRAPTSDAALELGLLLDMLGRPGAEDTLTRVARLAETATQPKDLARAGRALQRLGRSQEANAAFRDATSVAPRDPDINTAWGELFLEKFNKAEALKSFQVALRQDPKWVPALIGSAKALADENPPQAGELIKQALEISPGSVAANLFVAQQHADAGQRPDARASLATALETNPNSLEARSLLAALAYIEDKNSEYDAELAKVLALAPKYGEAYRVVGEMASHNFRYDDAAALVRKGVALDPGNAQILSDMGIHLLRTGDEPEARTVLEQSFKIDDFNQVTYNLLQMMDTLDTFVSVSDGNITVKMDKAEAPVLGEYAVPLTRQAIDTLSKRYNFTPKGPIVVEIFPKHDDFAVRTAGLPGLIGALGVCFGRVVTMDSPRARPGEFQWQATLWHELAHVITLQMSNHRVPRWLTEGISEYEERVQNPEWKRTMEMEFATVMNRGEVMALKNLNAGFTDPRKITIAYYQASLLVEHLVKTFGDAGMQRLLLAFGEGLDTDAAMKKAYNTDFDGLQAGFDQLLEQKFGTLRKALAPPPRGTDLARMPVEMLRAFVATNPDSFGGHMFLGEAAATAENFDEAAKAFTRAAELAPVATGEDSPQQRLADVEIQRKDTAAAVVALKKALEADVDDAALPRKLAALLKERNVTNPAELRPVYQRISDIDPFDADAHSMLGRLAMQAGQPEAAVREFKAVVALGPIDKAAAHTDLAESYLRSGKRTDARRQTLAALEIAPSYERAQDLLLQLAGSNP